MELILFSVFLAVLGLGAFLYVMIGGKNKHVQKKR